MHAGLLALGIPPPYPHAIGIVYTVLAVVVTCITYFVSFGRCDAL